MTPADYSVLDATALAELIARRETSCEAAMAAAIAAAQALNPALNAIVDPFYDEALAAARKADQKPPAERSGPFYGVPFLVKDLELPWSGSNMSRGSRFLAGAASPPDAPLSEALRASGIIAFGKTNTPEFGITGTTEPALFGPCRNPYATDRISGGSSGGSAAAVAAGIAPLAHAADGAGSIRIPAACCGLVGLLPSRGRTRSPGAAGDVFHAYARHFVVSRSVRDSATMLEAVRDHSPYAPPALGLEAGASFAERRDPPPLRIRWSPLRISGRPVDPPVHAALERTAALLSALGHQVTEGRPALNYGRFYRSFGTVGAAQLARDIEDYAKKTGRTPDDELFEPLTLRNLSFGRSRSGTQVIHALREVKQFAREMDAVFTTLDVLVEPVLGVPVPEVGWLDPNLLDPKEQDRRSAIAFPTTPPANGTGQPSISLPLGMDADGLPIGVMFTARYGADATLLQLAYQLEEAAPWAQRRPALHAAHS
ncbi:MAG: amidase family protein [Pseudomonadota bacterium]